MTKFTSAKFNKIFVQALSHWEFKEQRANSVDLDEAACYEPPHLYLLCLPFQLFTFLALQMLDSNAIARLTAVEDVRNYFSHIIHI